MIIAAARKGKFPPLVDPDISRDFVHIDDVCNAFVMAAARVNDIKGAAFNIGTGVKTTIRDLSHIIMRQYGIDKAPEFGSMPNRNWDVKDWYANSEKAKEVLGWTAGVALKDGLAAVGSWQEEVDFDNVFWNWNK